MIVVKFAIEKQDR